MAKDHSKAKRTTPTKSRTPKKRPAPKRTNDFQKLVFAIEIATAPIGAKVTQSAVVMDRDAEREGDILIEYEIGGHPYKIAVECRDHKNVAQNLTWIDSLVGKYKDTNVNLIVAVTSTGFTPQAITKAQNNRIQLLTLKEATEADWAGKLLKTYTKILSTRITPYQYGLLYKEKDTPKLSDAEFRNTVISNGRGETVGIVNEFMRDAYDSAAQASVDNYIAINMKELMSSPINRTLDLTMPAEVRDLFIRAENRTYEIAAVEFRVKVDLIFTDASDKHFIYNDMVVTQSTASTSDQTVELGMIQRIDPEKGREFKLFRKEVVEIERSDGNN